jgi:hypothetical protein
MASTRRRRRLMAVTLLIILFSGRMSVGLVAASLTTESPAPGADAQFEAFRNTCITSPAGFVSGAAHGVYSEQVIRSREINQVCTVYSSPTASLPAGKWLGEYKRLDCIRPQPVA